MKDDRGTDEWRNDADGNDATIARKCAQQVACQSQVRSDEHRGRHEGSMPGCAECQASQVGHSKSDERDRATESCRSSCEQSGNE